MNKLVLAAAVATFASAADAGSLGPYDDLLVFGDSLSDPGNVVNRVFFGAEDIPGVSITNRDAYPFRQWSDGTTWAAKLGADFDSGRNFAYGGARAASQNPDLPGILDLFEQVEAYVTPDGMGDNPITVVAIGGNDFLGYFKPDDPAPKPPLDEFVVGLAQTIVANVATLATKNLSDFVVFGLPDLGKRPNQDPLTAGFLSSLTSQFNGVLSQFVAGLNEADNGINASFFDIAAILAPIFDGDGPFSITDAQCVIKDALDNVVSICDNPGDYIFHDQNHPTDGVHALIADAFVDHITPVPLPAGAPLLLVGLAALGVASRRRVAGRSI